MNLPKAPDRYSPQDQDLLRNALELAVSSVEQRPVMAQWGADRGDNNVTINAGTDAEIVRFATALTANRTVTLGSGYAGAKFTIVRTGLGAFTLAVGALKTLAAGTAAWADVGHDGTAWFLVRQGVL
jgi:hypothetical protein